MGRARPARLSSILLAHDGSPGAERAATRVAHLPLAQGAAVHVVQAGAVTGEATDASREALQGHAVAVRRRLEAAGRGDVEVLHALVEGERAHEELIRYGRVHGAELVVVGRHRDRAAGEPSIGSTALQLLRHGDAPLLVAVEGGGAAAYRRPVVAVDLTDASRQVVELALALLGEPAPTLTVVHALHVPFQGAFAWALSKRGVDDMRQEAVREARSRAARFVDTLRPLDASIDVAIAEGETSLAVVREVARRAADLVVVGTHGRSGLSHAVFGSVAEWIVASAPCDVAVTRPTRHTFDLP